MHVCAPVRAFLYFCTFAFAVVLMGLTGYRIHYTKTLDNGDILTTSTNFYDPIIVELLVTSALTIIFSIWLSIALLARVRSPGAASFATEQVLLWIIWIMFLVGAAITTHNWHNLKWCRGSQKVCRILETIKAFAWIIWVFLTFLIVASLAHLAMGSGLGLTSAISGEDDDGGRGTRTRGQPAQVVTPVDNTREVGQTTTATAPSVQPA